MNWRHLALVGTIVLTACAKRGPEFREPVGQTMARSPSRSATAHIKSVASSGTQDEADGYLMGQTGGPCGMDPLPIIGFAFGSSQLDEPQLVELKRVAGCLTTGPYETTSIVLVGYSDVVGTVSANLTLGLERAQAVMRGLLDQGVSPGRIVVASAGELQRPRARWGLRADRVEILVARGGPPRPDEAPIARGIDAEGMMPRPRQVTNEPPGRTTSQRPNPTPRPPSRPAAPPRPSR